MSYNQKPPGSSGSGMGGGPPNGPNNIPQVAKTFAGIQQQMQNLVHGQNAIPQSSQADINAFLQQQRIQNMLKQQQQFLQFQHQMQQQQQQHQQQQHQHHNMGGGGGVGPGPVGGVTGVGGVAGPGSGGAGGSGEPLALTRTAGATELLNKTYQQQANGNPAANSTFNQLQQTLQALPTNFVQQLQVFQYQMQAKQMQQQQHGGGQGQHGHGQQQSVQGIPPPPPTTTSVPHQQQQQQQQKHQNQHQQQQQQNALSRYLTAAAAQAAVASGNKMSSATPPPPPLTNQMKPPNLPPNTQITPVTAPNMVGGNISAGPHPKMSTGNTNAGTAKHPGPPPSISLTPSKPATSGPSVAHQQNKFTPPTNSGHKGGHLGHSQNLPKSTHGATHTATSNTTSPAKTGTNADASSVAALKSPQSTPVQLTKLMPPLVNTAAMSNKTLANATTTTTTTPAAATTTAATATTATSSATITTEATSTNVSPIKSAASTTATTVSTPTVANTLTTSAAVGLNSNTTTTAPSTASTTNATSTKSAIGDAAKSTVHDSAATKQPLNSANAEKETPKTCPNDVKDAPKDSSAASNAGGTKKETEKPKEKKLESEAEVSKPTAPTAPETATKEPVKESNESKSNSVKNTSSKAPAATLTTLESKKMEKKLETSEKAKTDQHDFNENEKKLTEDKKDGGGKNKPATTDDKSCSPAKTPAQEPGQEPLSQRIDIKKSAVNLNQTKASLEEKKLESKEKILEKEIDKDKTIKTNKSLAKIEQVEGVESKDTPKITTTADKPIAGVETKMTPSTTSQTVPLIKTLKRDEANTKNLVEANIKKDTCESGSSKKEEKQTVSTTEEVDSSKSVAAVAENKNDVSPKDDASDSLKPIKSIDKTETSTSAKPALSQTAGKKTNTEDSVKDSIPTAQKETVATEATPLKKVGRFAKGAKSKSVAATTPVENKKSELQEDKPSASSARAKRKPKADNSHISDSAPSTPQNDDSDRKSKRHRLKTILYQSPLPELAYITKLSASEASNSPKPMSNEDRLIVFYKNEYMAVRNAEGTFYLCQTMQNVYRTSPRISIRWLSEDAKDNNVFIPDFYDHTDIECVLTTVELKRIDKGHLRLPKGERNRIESILKKAIDVEKGLVPRPELTEENPDGLDISLFKDESQIEKKSALTEGGVSQTPSIASGRKPRRAAIASASSTRRSFASAATPSTSSGNKRKRNATSAAASSSSSRKMLTKKRRTLVKRKKKSGISDDDDESSDDYESDAEYKPTQKRSSLNASGVSKSAPRAQRSPLAKARAASPITPTTSRSKNVPQKTILTPTPSTSKVSRGERAAKRKSIIDAGSSEDASVPVKKPTTTSNNKSKADKHANEATPVKNSSLIDNINVSNS